VLVADFAFHLRQFIQVMFLAIRTSLEMFSDSAFQFVLFSTSQRFLSQVFHKSEAFVTGQGAGFVIFSKGD
jgi:hypothetical protein